MKPAVRSVPARYVLIVVNAFVAVVAVVATVVMGACSSGPDHDKATSTGRPLANAGAASASNDDVEIPEYACTLCLPDGKCFTATDFDEDQSRYVAQREACGLAPGERPDRGCRTEPSDATCTTSTTRIPRTVLELIGSLQPH